jgi:hypothetical protein
MSTGKFSYNLHAGAKCGFQINYQYSCTGFLHSRSEGNEIIYVADFVRLVSVPSKKYGEKYTAYFIVIIIWQEIGIEIHNLHNVYRSKLLECFTI